MKARWLFVCAVCLVCLILSAGLTSFASENGSVCSSSAAEQGAGRDPQNGATAADSQATPEVTEIPGTGDIYEIMFFLLLVLCGGTLCMILIPRLKMKS